MYLYNKDKWLTDNFDGCPIGEEGLSICVQYKQFETNNKQVTISCYDGIQLNSKQEVDQLISDLKEASDFAFGSGCKSKDKPKQFKDLTPIEKMMICLN